MPTQSRKTILLAADQQNSVLNALDANQRHLIAYTPYGHHPWGNGLLGFNGELPDPVTGHYHLGRGYRQFNPVLMRFNSPDSWSPFGEGGLNAYAYCNGDSVNQVDPTGHTGLWGRFIKGFKNRIGIRIPGESKIARKLMFIDVDHQDMLNRLSMLKGESKNPIAPPVKALNSSNSQTNYSPYSDMVEPMHTDELDQFWTTTLAWSDTDSEKRNLLNAITREKKIRSHNIHNKPPISNRDIRKGELGYKSD